MGGEDGRVAWRNFWVDGKGSNILSVVLVTWVHCTIYNVALNKLSYLWGRGLSMFLNTYMTLGQYHEKFLINKRGHMFEKVKD